VPKEDYQAVSSLTRFAVLMGKFMSGFLSQILDSFDLMSYKDLNYISLSSVSLAFLISWLLPSVATSVYFYRPKEGDGEEGEETRVQRQSIKSTIQLILSEAKSAYSNSYVVKWSVWVAISPCLNFQV